LVIEYDPELAEHFDWLLTESGALDDIVAAA
jgi:hypothetical protein